MSEEEFVENMQETNDLLDDERSRTRGGFHHSQPGTNNITPESAQPTSSGDPGYDSFRVNKSQISGTAIQVIRSTVPHLAHLPDDYLASQPIDALIRANTAAKQADQSGTAKGADGRLNHNFQKAMANPVDVTGTDNRSSILHPARFLPGAGVPAQRLWPNVCVSKVVHSGKRQPCVYRIQDTNTHRRGWPHNPRFNEGRSGHGRDEASTAHHQGGGVIRHAVE